MFLASSKLWVHLSLPLHSPREAVIEIMSEEEWGY